MKKTYFLILIAILISNTIFSQVISIGTEDVRTTGLPIDPFYKYSYTQEIYLSSEINHAGDITQLTFKVAPERELNNSNEWVVYLAHTTKTSFNSTTDWIGVSDITQVYSGTFVHSPGADIILNLDVPFNYNGVDNLLLAVEDNSSGYDSGSDDLLASSVSDNRAIMYRSDSENPDPASPPIATNIQSFVANIDISFGDSDPCSVAYDIIDDDFESYPAGVGEALPDCWTSIAPAGMVIGTRNSAGEANSGTNYISAYVSVFNNQDAYIITPKLNTIDGGHEADFFIKTSIPGATYQLGTMSDPNDNNTFTSLGDILTLTTSYVNVNTGSISASSDEYFVIKLSAPEQHTVIRIDDFKWSSSLLTIGELNNSPFIIYPNPSYDGKLHIEQNNVLLQKDINITIFNITGKQVYSSILNADKTIDISHMQPGTYIVKLQSDSVFLVEKIVLK